MANVDGSDIKQAQASLLAMGANLERNVPQTVEDQVDELLHKIKRKIDEKGLIGDPSDKPDQQPLIASFQKSTSGASQWTIFSSADHAMALEKGADPHPIRPNDADLLAWEPENPSDYPQRTGPVSEQDGDDRFLRTWYDPEAGMVFSLGVRHPGNDEYNYIFDAQAAWAPIAHIRVEQAVEKSIVQAGFKPASGGR